MPTYEQENQIFFIESKTTKPVQTTFCLNGFTDPFAKLRSLREVKAHSDYPRITKTKRTEIGRNSLIVDGFDRQGKPTKHIKIVAPMGGYKKFLIIPTGGDPKDPYLLTDYAVAKHRANIWYMDEKQKCLPAISSKNYASRQRTKRARLSSSFGDPEMLNKVNKHSKQNT